jgi:hypothetical protein
MLTTLLHLAPRLRKSGAICLLPLDALIAWKGICVTDFRSWGANRAQLRCPDDVSDDIWMSVWTTRRGLKPKFYRLPRPWSLWGSSPARENSQGRTGNQTRHLMDSSQKFWPPSYEAGQTVNIINGNFMLWSVMCLPTPFVAMKLASYVRHETWGHSSLHSVKI